ncbi:hypothetical protein PINS_up024033 [Pythium insidiosum]|nr:hypothetical protein PINS_up024033 [Pythium insidiosum]
MLQQQRGCRSTPKPQTLKNRLSSFQCEQLTTTQKRLFLAMLRERERRRSPPQALQSGTNASVSLYLYLSVLTSFTSQSLEQHVIEELAKDKPRASASSDDCCRGRPQREARYAKLDDERHCRFRPKSKRSDGASGSLSWVGTDDDDDDDDDNGTAASRARQDFIRRMEADERVRVEQLRRTRAEREYNARPSIRRVSGVRQSAVVHGAHAEAQEVPQLRRLVPQSPRVGASPPLSLSMHRRCRPEEF